MHIDRHGLPSLRHLRGSYPVVTIVGPRQSGKTTLAQKLAPELTYVNLEDLRHRDFALSDPVGFIEQYRSGAIFDEIQRCPDITSQLQVVVDADGINGRFVLTGSHQFEVMERVSQSLAGRTTIFRLLPLSLAELTDAGHDRTSDAMLLGGFYPRPLVEKIEPVSFYQDYITTYLERDLRQLSEVRNLSSFRRFLALCAGRVGQILDLQALGNDVGVSQPTARAWMSLLEASYIVFLLPPYFANIGKRLVKRPKLYFYDVGVAAHLLGMSSLNHVTTHPLRGNLFENLVIMEWIKQRWNKHLPHNAYFYRDQSRNEIDLVVTDGDRIHLVEVKAGQTITEDYFRGIRSARKTRLSIDKAFVVYDGSERQTRSEAEVLPLRELHRLNLDAD